jgi:hypothetical protein
VNKRRSLTPNTGMPNVLPRAQARRGGARQTASDRVTFRNEAGDVREGWALNVSRGGLRAILDDDTGKVELGEEYVIAVGDDGVDATAGATVQSTGRAAIGAGAGGGERRGRIVWLQEEPDGFVVGVEYLSPSGKHLAAPSVPVPSPSSDAVEPAVEASGVNPAASVARVRADSSSNED